MTIELSEDEARVWMGFIDITLKAKGTEALDAAFAFRAKIELALKAEQKAANEPPVTIMPPAQPAAQG